MAEEATNRLGGETSPYLLQHATNPVDWYPWGDEALQKARREDKPIFLSVGYSACHWCHVMERESFEDEAIAEMLNEHFVNIKVDREERPDVDRLYMDAVQIMSGQGGWPMSVFLTPGLEPFFAGTYFPPRSKFGRPGFTDVIEEIHRAWSEERERIEAIGDRMRGHLQKMADQARGADALSDEPIHQAADALSRRFDARNGGFGNAPKFPPTSQCSLLLRVATDEQFSKKQRRRALRMVETTLVHMASGGIYDHLGGGFHRYSVDERWLIPHFEKMLYDNALLMNLYREAYQATGRPFYRRIVEEIGGYVLREMTDRDATGAFFATQDADSEGVEGKFFVWTPESLQEVLGPERGRRAAQYWGVTEGGNFEEGKSVLHRLHDLDGDEQRIPSADLDDDMAAMRTELLEARSERIHPERDDKIIAAWNGLMIESLASAGWTLNRSDLIDAARGAAEFVVQKMCGDGRARGLHRTHKDGRTRHDACLDDYASMAVGLTALYEATGEKKWLDDGQRLVDEMVARFSREDGGFYYSAEGRSDLIVRQTDLHDRATPSGNARAMEALYGVATWTGDGATVDRLDKALCSVYENMEQQAPAMTHMVSVLDAHLQGPIQIVCARGDGDGHELVDTLRQAYLRQGAAVVFDPTSAPNQPPLVRDKVPVDGSTAIYVCERGSCSAPVGDAEEFEEALAELVAAAPIASPQ